MQHAEQVGQTLATAHNHNNYGKKNKCNVVIAVPVDRDVRSNVIVPMELGTANFRGKCHNCGRVGHKAAQCPSLVPVSQVPPTTQRNKNGKQPICSNFNNL